MPTQIFVSELNKYIREHKLPNMTVGMRWEDKRESNDSTIEPGKIGMLCSRHSTCTRTLCHRADQHVKQNNMHLQDAPIITLEAIASLQGCLLSGDTTIAHTVFVNHV